MELVDSSIIDWLSACWFDEKRIRDIAASLWESGIRNAEDFSIIEHETEFNELMKILGEFTDIRYVDRLKVF